MLALTRKPDESIVLSNPSWTEDITITLVTINPVSLRARIGIQAPCSVSILRSELLKKAEAKQGEAIPNIWFRSDREAAKHRTTPLTKEYIAALEQIARLSDVFWTEMSPRAMSPEQNALSDDLLDALSVVNFLSEQDSIEEEEAALASALA